MLAELFNAIVGVSQKAKAHDVKIVDFPNDPDRRYLFIDDKQEVLQTPRRPPDPSSKVLSIADLAAAYICRFHASPPSEEGETPPDPPEVWYTIRGAMFFLDEPNRRQRVDVGFTESDVWKTIRGLKGARIFQHEALIRLLRHDLSTCGVKFVLDAFRTMNYSVMQNARNTINHGNQSMDADLVADAKAGGVAAPEMFTLNFPPYSDLELSFLRQNVIVTIDIDAQNKAITLQLLPDEVEKVETAMRLTVRDKLQDEMPDGTVLLAGTA